MKSVPSSGTSELPSTPRMGPSVSPGRSSTLKRVWSSVLTFPSRWQDLGDDAEGSFPAQGRQVQSRDGDGIFIFGYKLHQQLEGPL